MALNANSLETGLQFHRAGRLAEAEQSYRQVLQKDPRNIDAHLALATLLAETGKAQQAVQHYEKALAIRPGYPDALLGLGQLLQAHGQLQDAAACYQAILEQPPQQHIPADKASLYLGEILEEAGDDAQALEAYKQAVSLNSDFQEAYEKLGALAFRHKLYDMAARCFEILLNKEPGNLEFIRNLGIVAYHQGNAEKTAECFDRLIALDPSDEKNYQYTADLHSRNKNWSEAAAYYRGMIDRYPEQAFLDLNLGNIYYHAGDMDRAIAAYLDYFRREPGLPPGKQRLLNWILRILHLYFRFSHRVKKPSC